MAYVYRDAYRAANTVMVTLVDASRSLTHQTRYTKYAFETEAVFVERVRADIATNVALLNAQQGREQDVTVLFRPRPSGPGG